MTRAAEKARYEWLHALGVCAVSGIAPEVHIHHILPPDAFFGKAGPTMGAKPHWIWTLPLHHEKHVERHSMNEREFWSRHGYPWGHPEKGPLTAALVLEGFRQVGDMEAARKWLLRKARL